MGLRKVYQSIHYKDLDTYIVVNGVKTLIQFRGGSLKPDIKGTYNTSDPAVIKAMDSDSGLNRTFRCIHSEEIPDGQTEDTPELATENTLNAEAPVVDDATITKVPDITTVQAAKAYLAEHYKVPISKMPNASAVKQYAAANKIAFVDLP